MILLVVNREKYQFTQSNIVASTNNENSHKPNKHLGQVNPRKSCYIRVILVYVITVS